MQNRGEMCKASAKLQLPTAKGLSTREVGRGHATPHVPVETTKINASGY